MSHGTSLQEIYGDKYQEVISDHNKQYIAGLVVSNVAGMNLREVKHDFGQLFEGNTISSEWVKYITSRVSKLQPLLVMNHITDFSSVPRLIPEERISYFRLIDLHRKKVYVIFITPFIMDCF